jgi:hypothetical protein
MHGFGENGYGMIGRLAVETRAGTAAEKVADLSAAFVPLAFRDRNSPFCGTNKPANPLI